MNKIRVTVTIIAILFIIFGVLIPTLFTDIFVQALIAVTWTIAGIVLMLLIFLTFIILD